jgi:hypothetical protein
MSLMQIARYQYIYNAVHVLSINKTRMSHICPMPKFALMITSGPYLCISQKNSSLIRYYAAV